MTDEKENSEIEKTAEPENEVKAATTPSTGELALAEIDTLRRQLEDAESKLADTVDGWQRSMADFQNYKRRIERDNELIRTSMKGDLLKKVLPVLDDLERALQNRVADDPWASGIELVARKFQNILDAEGLKRIEAKGVAFDPAFHEAISHEPSDIVPSEHVIDVVQTGYMLGERVIRPALVRVAQ